jgi:hypothetical protein
MAAERHPVIPSIRPESSRAMNDDTANDGGRPLTEAGAAASNAALWAVYLRRQTRALIDPFRLLDERTADAIARPIADIAAAATTAWFSLFTSAAVGRSYRQNAPSVNAFVAEQAIDAAAVADAVDIPAQFAARRREYPAPFETTQIEAWRMTPPRPREPVSIR